MARKGHQPSFDSNVSSNFEFYARPPQLPEDSDLRTANSGNLSPHMDVMDRYFNSQRAAQIDAPPQRQLPYYENQRQIPVAPQNARPQSSSPIQSSPDAPANIRPTLYKRDPEHNAYLSPAPSPEHSPSPHTQLLPRQNQLSGVRDGSASSRSNNTGGSSAKDKGLANGSNYNQAKIQPGISSRLSDQSGSQLPKHSHHDPAMSLENAFNTAQHRPSASVTSTPHVTPSELQRTGPSRVMLAGHDSLISRKSAQQSDTLAIAFLFNMQQDVPPEHWGDTYRAFTTIFNDYSQGKLSLQLVCKRAIRLFQHYPQLTDEFFMVLPYAGLSDYWIGSRNYNELTANEQGMPMLLDEVQSDVGTPPVWTARTSDASFAQLVHTQSMTYPSQRTNSEATLPSKSGKEGDGGLGGEQPSGLQYRKHNWRSFDEQIAARLRTNHSVDSRHVLINMRDEQANNEKGAGETQSRVVVPHIDEKHIAEIRRKLEQQGVASKQNFKDWRDVSYWLVPHGRGQYINYFTIVLSMVLVLAFFFMAGQAAMQQLKRAVEDDPSLNVRSYLQDDDFAASPGAMWDWATLSPGDRYTFDFDTLLRWGGRYGPSLRDGQWWRIFTSLFLHQNAKHLLANWLLLLLLGVHLEHNYSSWRILLVWVLSGVGGNLASAAFESQCTLVVGSSGAMFGLMGFFIADLLLNFESISYPFLRLLLVGLFLVFFLITMFTGAQTENASESHWSHIGGLLCGLFPSFLFLPNVKDQRWRALRDVVKSVAHAHSKTPRQPRSAEEEERHRAQQERQQQVLAHLDAHRSVWSRFFVHPCALVGCLVMLLVFVALPTYVFASRLDDLQCK